jgi:heme/copper-type cytochrome/quinol oxidase subunit 2
MLLCIEKGAMLTFYLFPCNVSKSTSIFILSEYIMSKTVFNWLLPGNKRQMPELSDKGNGTLIGIIVGICLALVVIVVVIAVVIRKTRTNNQGKHMLVVVTIAYFNRLINL